MNKHYNLQLMTDGNYKNKGFFLDDYYNNWELGKDDFDRLVLIPKELSLEQKLERGQINIHLYNQLKNKKENL